MDLDGIVPQGRGHVPQPLHPAEKLPEIPQVFLLEESVFVLFQLFRQIQQLFVVVLQVADLHPDLVEPADGQGVLVIFQDRLFHGVHLQLQPGHQRQVVLYDLLQEIVEEALQTGGTPAPGVPYGLHDGFRGSGIVNEDDALFIQRKGELHIFRIEVFPVRDAEGSGEGIVVDLGVGGEDLGLLRFLNVHAEIELFFLCTPCGIAEEGDILRVVLADHRFCHRFQCFTDRIIHGALLSELFFCALLYISNGENGKRR